MLNGRAVEIRRTDYKWDPCWGVFDVATDQLLPGSRDTRKGLVRQWIRDEQAKEGRTARR